jgi:hypothetical protein
MAIVWKRAIPDYFCESKRMAKMMGNAYHPNDSRMIAHDNVVQLIRKGGTENQGLHFAKDGEAQIVPLGVRCTGNPTVKESMQKVNELVAGGVTHYQFATIYVAKVRVMEQRSMQKKKPRRSIFVDDYELGLASASDSDNGGDDDGDDDVMNVVPSM